MVGEDATKNKLLFFEDLYKKYNIKLVNYAFSIIKDYASSEDIVQDAFALYLQQEDISLNYEQSRSWLYKTVLYKCLNHPKKEANTQSIDETIVAIKSVEEDFFDNISKCEDSSAICKMVNALSEENKKLFNIYYIQKLSHKEVADLLNISIDASKAKKMRLRHKCVKVLEKSGYSFSVKEKGKEGNKNGKDN